MVLESIADAIKADKSPYLMILVGFVYSSIALFLALWVFRNQADLVMVFFTVMASMPFFYLTIKQEGMYSSKTKSDNMLIKQHMRAIFALLFLFIGFTLSFTLWYVVLPASTVQSAFTIQAQTILNINSNITGQLANPAATLVKIVLNNIKVLTFCILFSFVYGLGAVFILTWNASIIATAIGSFIKSRITENASGLAVLIPHAIFRYFLHGIPEILAYIVGGLAGGIISVAIVNYSLRSKAFEKSLYDASRLLAIALMMLIIAGIIEVFITPIIF